VNVYTPGGQKLAAYTVAPGVDNNNGQSTPFIAVGLATSDQYFGGRRLASMDQLGSVGNYFPWGEDKGGTSPQDTWNFATYWRDSVSGLDYANNRYYSNAYGRFMTPDPYKANNGGPGDPRDPGSWNKYAYTRGDPANRIDPTGTCDLNITSIAPDGTIVIDCIDFPTDGGGGGTGGGGGSAGNQPTSNPCQSLLSGGLYDSYEVCMAALQQSQQQQQCVQSFSSSSLGAATEFLSVVNLLQNLGSISTVLDWTLLPYAKVEALKVIQDLSSTIGNTDFYSIAGASQTASIETELGAALQLLESEAAAPLLFAAVPIATAIDAGVQQMCNAVPGLRFNSQ
jgi:RHS repeat-associated protein